MEDVYVAADAAFDDEPACLLDCSKNCTIPLQPPHDPTRRRRRMALPRSGRGRRIDCGEWLAELVGPMGYVLQATSILGSGTTLLCSTTPRCANTTSPRQARRSRVRHRPLSSCARAPLRSGSSSDGHGPSASTGGLAVARRERCHRHGARRRIPSARGERGVGVAEAL